jgi:hypothetical protein
LMTSTGPGQWSVQKSLTEPNTTLWTLQW